MKYNESDTAQTQQETQTSFSTISPGEIVIGTLVEVDEQGHPHVDFSGNPSEQPSKAITTLVLTQTHIGRQVALLFANGNMKNPVIMGVIHSPLHAMLENFGQVENKAEGDVPDEAEQESGLEIDDVLIDGKKIIFEAKEQIVLKCGESSITLTQSGNISIRGKYLLNRSTGVNRIMGGSVKVN
ncbi:hypothetical protein MNBD_GAMMA18-2360 [hydrothermal vent metagenome]|uniref:DUF6484 domain-containing protein n=1 Tax=hydrothermal vent metagenome TaxID=652676 RepID=A0A3B0YYV9_9ZZZZ